MLILVQLSVALRSTSVLALCISVLCPSHEVRKMVRAVNGGRLLWAPPAESVMKVCRSLLDTDLLRDGA